MHNLTLFGTERRDVTGGVGEVEDGVRVKIVGGRGVKLDLFEKDHPMLNGGLVGAASQGD
jgi:hypothetical protein